ncbi:S8 family serine peptidase [Streptosporangium canum]|uniref:S8 family serine peptidase n=1 Tax=Streptosporangium canum TaxID=324952 RepID=UPI003426F8DB
MAARTLARGVDKLWLDRKVHATLAESVPLIGAPQAWAAGLDGTGVKVAVLDTGVDAGHPDLQGKIVASQSFVPGQEVADGHGHGTHVASTIAGSGSASGGKNKGVAPGAQLMIGKVLSNEGNGDSSWIIDAMEWAASSGARVVSMSIGSEPSDGGDPLSQAVNELTESTGALFVIAAGNDGVTGRIGAPGAADAALTVAATDKTDGLAGFSTRGPRLDGALKPDIAAPGVDIVAGRATGTAMGRVVDDFYTAADGTSMATPHVSGAAAILVQQHPDWKAVQYKAALMSTSKDVALTAYEAGAGRVDVVRATTQKVVTTTPNLDFGTTDGEKEPVTKQVTYANLGDQPVTLTLTPTFATGGKPVEGVLTADKTVTVPAGGAATATVTLNMADLAFGAYSGSVVAEADGIRVVTPAGLSLRPPTVTLTVRTIGRDGAPLNPVAMDTVDVTGPHGRSEGAYLVGPGVAAIQVPEGTHSVAQLAQWIDDDSEKNTAWLINPEVKVSGDTEITLDLRKASQIRFTTPKPAMRLNNQATQVYQRTTSDGLGYAVSSSDMSWTNVWVTPTERVTKGKLRFWHEWTLGQAEVSMSVTGKAKRDLLPVSSLHYESYTHENPLVETQNGFPNWIPFTGTRNLPVVNVGLGRPEDLAGLDLKGKLALMEVDADTTSEGFRCVVRIERVGPIREAGAAGILAFGPPGSETTPSCSLPIPLYQTPYTGAPKEVGIPNVALSTKEGLALRDQLAKEPVTIRVAGTPHTPYSYALKPYEEGRIPASLHYSYTSRNLAQIDVEHPATEQTRRFSDYRYAWKQDDALLNSQSIEWGAATGVGPHTRRDYVGPLSADVIQLNSSYSTPMGPGGETSHVIDVYDRPIRTTQRMHVGPLTLGGYTATDKAYKVPDAARPFPLAYEFNTPCDMCRRGNLLFPFVHTVGQSDGLQQFAESHQITYDFKLTRDGVEIPLRGPAFELPAERAAYKLNATRQDTDVTWTFTSARPTENTVKPGHICAVVSTDPCRAESLVYVTYDLGSSLDRDNKVRAGKKHKFTVNVSHGPTLEKTPKIAGLKLWASTDDGRQWTPVQVKKNRDGTFTADTAYPRFNRTTGTVSLKAEAWDDAGNRIDQTTLKSFALRD